MVVVYFAKNKNTPKSFVVWHLGNKRIIMCFLYNGQMVQLQ